MRDELIAELDRLAREYRPRCPYATSVLHTLIAAIETDMDFELATIACAWLRRELCITREILEDLTGRRPARCGGSNLDN